MKKPLFDLDVTHLEIVPLKNELFPVHVKGQNIATFKATVNESLVVSGSIKASKKGIYCTYPKGISFLKDAKKTLSNRILATYVINYCIEENG